MMHQRNKARTMARKHGMDGGAPPLPSVPDMGPMNSQPPMPGGMTDPSQMMQAPPDGGMAGLLHPEGNAAYARPVDLTLAWSPPTILDTQTGCHRVATQADVDRLAKENRQLSGAVEKIRRALFPGDCAKRSA